jgi:hypothetical protein
MYRCPVIARVECRSESCAEQRPFALWLGGRRALIANVDHDAVVGSVDPCAEASRIVSVCLDDGSRYELERSLPTGRWRVYKLPHPDMTSGTPGKEGSNRG